MAYKRVNEESLIAVADAIREKTGGTDALVFPEEFADRIRQISTGGAPVIGQLTVRLSASGTGISFSGLPGEPRMFTLNAATQFNISSSQYITGLTYDGASFHSTLVSGTVSMCGSGYTYSYDAGTLRISAGGLLGGNFRTDVDYILTYVV